MKITDVKTIVISCPLKKPVETTFGRMVNRTNVLVKIETDEGITGIGETWVNYPHWAYNERKITIEKGLKPLLIGENPLNISYLWNKLYVCLLRSGAGFQYESKGPLYQSISGVDIALWDILGKKLNVPVFKLLGGRVCSSIRSYASGLWSGNYEECVEESIKKGYTAFKLKVGFNTESDVRILKVIRNMIGEDCLLMADANQAWMNAKEALDNIKQYTDYNLEFIEEPVPANQLSDLRKIKESGILPVAGGENLYSRYGFKDTLVNEILSIVQPDVTKTGGISETRIICQMAQAWHIPFAPHMFGTAVGIAASLHILASIPNGLYMETDSTPNLLQTELLKDSFYKFKDGYFTLSDDKPGLGIELDEDFVKEYVIVS